MGFWGYAEVEDNSVLVHQIVIIWWILFYAFRKVGEYIYGSNRVPTRTAKPGKPGKMGRHFPVREKSGNFEQTGKVREKSGKITQNTGKLREFEINII